jgi:hypothetical protein
MPHVFMERVGQPNAPPNEPLTLSASYDGRKAQLTARTGSVSRSQNVAVSSALGWTLALPFQWYIEDTRTELVASLIWMACLTVPIGYWGAYAARVSDARPNVLVAVLFFLAGVAIVIAGLVRIRHATGLQAAPTREWLAAMSGIIAGGAMALRVGKRRSGEVGENKDEATMLNLAAAAMTVNVSPR